MEIAPEYGAQLFVTPTKAYRLILSKVQRWKEAQPKGTLRDKIWRARHRSLQTAPGDQVLGIVGERGGGKTWLLRHLAEDESRVSPVALYLDLEKRTDFTSPEDYARTIAEQVRERRGNSRAVLLLDSLPPYLDKYLRALEDTVLKPELMHRGALVIMALVHPTRVCWRAPALRGAERCMLPLFDETQTREQLWQLHKAGVTQEKLKASWVQESGGGLPLFNYLLATRERLDACEALQEHWLARIPAADRYRVRNYLEAVCTLDSLDHAKIQRALEVYNRHHPDDGRHPAHPGDVRNMLRKHWLARSMPESPGRLELVDSIRRATREVLRAREAELYVDLEAIV